MLAELLTHPGVEEELTLRSRFGFLAFHGGSLERQTDVVAREAAARSGSSLYAVLQPEDLRWHIPSKEVDPTQSSALSRFFDHVETVVAVHGYGRPDFFTTLLLGGRNRPLATHLTRHLRPELPDYRIIDDLDEIPEALRGRHPRNPVNRARAGGVQLELPPRVRGLGPFWAGRAEDGLVPHAESLVAGLSAAVRAWPASTPEGHRSSRR